MSYAVPGSESAAGLLDGYVAWQHPHRDTQIYVHQEIVRTLSAHAVDSAQNGWEIGGVLWGKAGPADSLIIVDARLVQSGGPFFNSTATDARTLQQVLTSRPPSATLSLAGFFRSSLREGYSLTPQDQTVIRQSITDPDTVFLVIKPGDNGVCTVGLSFWQDGVLRTDASSSEVPFVASDEQAVPDPARLEENGTRKPEESARASVKQASADSRTTSAGQDEPAIVAMLRESAMRQHPSKGPGAPAQDAHSKPQEPGRNRNAVFLLLAFASICFIIVVAVAGVYLGLPLLRARLQGGSQQRVKLGLDLQTARAADGQLTLSWNRDAPEIVKASGGFVMVTDGHRTTKLKLDNAQLRSGTLLFRPKSDNVQFRLELNTDKQHTLTEALRVHSPAAEAARVNRAQNRERSNRPAPASLRSEWIASAEDIPTRVQVIIPETSNGISAPVPPPAADVQNGAASGVPAPASPANAYIPPQVVEEMMPEATPLGQFARISVQVSIDGSGYVTAAHVLNEGDADNTTLAAMATAAARRWHFRPASLNGKPVPAEYRIVFALRQKSPE